MLLSRTNFENCQNRPSKQEQQTYALVSAVLVCIITPVCNIHSIFFVKFLFVGPADKGTVNSFS